MFALIGENGQGIGTSPFADWVKNVSTLNVLPDEKVAVDALIDDCYARMDEGIAQAHTILFFLVVFCT